MAVSYAQIVRFEEVRGGRYLAWRVQSLARSVDEWDFVTISQSVVRVCATRDKLWHSDCLLSRCNGRGKLRHGAKP